MKINPLGLFIASLFLFVNASTQASHSAGNNSAGGRVSFHGSVTEAGCKVRIMDTDQQPQLDCSKRGDIKYTEAQRLAEIDIRYLNSDKNRAIVIIDYH